MQRFKAAKTWLDVPDAAHAELRPLRQLADPLAASFDIVSFADLHFMLDDSFGPPSRQYWDSELVEELSDEMIDVLLDHASQLAALQLDGYDSITLYPIRGAASRDPDLPASYLADRRPYWDAMAVAFWRARRSSDLKATSCPPQRPMGSFFLATYM